MGHDPQPVLLREGHEFPRIDPGIGRDTAELAFPEQVALVAERGNIGEVNPRERQCASRAERLQRGGHQLTHRREEDCRIQLFRRRVGGPLDRGDSELRGQLTRSVAPGHDVDTGTPREGDLGREMGAATETVDAEHAPVRQCCAAEGPVARNPPGR